jgi:hypothetical protein
VGRLIKAERRISIVGGSRNNRLLYRLFKSKGRDASRPFFLPLFTNVLEVWNSRTFANGRSTSVSPTRLTEPWLWGLRVDALPSRCHLQVEDHRNPQSD